MSLGLRSSTTLATNELMSFSRVAIRICKSDNNSSKFTLKSNAEKINIDDRDATGFPNGLTVGKLYSVISDPKGILYITPNEISSLPLAFTAGYWKNDNDPKTVVFDFFLFAKLLIFPLILLRHRIGVAPVVLRGALQHGHRARVVARATIRCRRIVAIEFATCRSGRTGGASGWTILGNVRRRELIGGIAGS